ncbi:type I restriction modification DNA specificity domain protein, partial [Lachnoanaerobaculum saburreum F0468]
IITGNTPSKNSKEFWNSKDICFIKPDIIADSRVHEVCESNEYISECARKKARIVSKDSIFVTCIGSIGKVGIAGEGEYAFNQQINAIVPNEKVNPRYLAYNLIYNKPRLVDIANAPVVPIINKSQFGEFIINIEFDINKQSRIVCVLDKLSSLIEKYNREIITLDKLIRARFVELFEEIKETCNVNYYIKELIAGKSLASEVECKNKVLKTGAASFDYFDGSQVKNLPINYEPKEEHLVHKGDIIISRMNTAELTGAAAYVWEVSDNVYIPDRLWKAVIRDGVNPIFLWNMLIQPSTKEQIQRVCSGTSGSMKNISKLGMLGIRVKKVDSYLQNEFATFVDQVNKSKLLAVSQPQIHIYKTLTLL